jgi:hypothetical protein
MNGLSVESLNLTTILLIKITGVKISCKSSAEKDGGTT